MQGLALHLLENMKIMMLEHKAPYKYELYGLVPQFYFDLFPPQDDGSACREPWKHSAMLDFFVPIAEEFFEKNKPGTIYSGMWVEELAHKRENPLQASAHIFDDYKIIIIQALNDDYLERIRLLRPARMNLLERRKVDADLVALRKKSLHDSLTGLYNHGAFMDILANNINYKVYHTNIAIIFIDIDNFKSINDTLGHLTGDTVLRELALVLKKSLRKHDVLARYGGEEFTVMAGRTSLKHAVVIGEKLRRSVESHEFNIGRPVTISLGVTTYKSGESPEELLNRADKALYEAKNSGKNKVVSRIPWL